MIRLSGLQWRSGKTIVPQSIISGRHDTTCTNVVQTDGEKTQSTVSACPNDAAAKAGAL